MNREEAEKRFARYCELERNQERTPAEAEEMKRLLYQVGLFIALKDGQTKEDYLAGNRATAQFHKQARELGVSEVAFVIGGVAASFFANGEPEDWFLECYGRFDRDPAPLQHARKELKAAGLWPWD